MKKKNIDSQQLSNKTTTNIVSVGALEFSINDDDEHEFEITCANLMTRGTVTYFILLITICAGNFYLYWQTSHGLRAPFKIGSIMFGLVFVAYVGIILKNLLYIKKAKETEKTKNNHEQKEEEEEEEEIDGHNTRHSRVSRMLSSVSGITRKKNVSTMRHVKDVYNSFMEVSGVNFLVGLTFLEFTEQLNIVINVPTVFSCILPLEVMIVLVVILLLQNVFLFMEKIYGYSQKKTENHILLDIVLDIIMAAFPTCLAWFAYDILLTPFELVRTIGIPSVFLIMRIEEILQQSIINAKHVAIAKQQHERASTMNRRRASVFGLTESETLFQKQCDSSLKYKKWNFFFRIWLVFYSMYLMISLISSIIGFSATANVCLDNKQTKNDDFMWESCVLKIPMCNRLFTPACNCASVNILKHNMSVMPKLFQEMTDLKKMRIKNGPLTKLPDNLGSSHAKLSLLHVGNNALNELPEDFPQLVEFGCKNNRLKKLPKLLWNSETLLALDAEFNFIEHLEIVNLPYIRIFYMGHNNLTTIPSKLMDSKYLEYIFLDGNQIASLPGNIGELRLLDWIFLSGNKIEQLPLSFDEIVSSASVVDLRNNFLKTVPQNYMDGPNLFLSNNPICNSTNGLRRFRTSCRSQCNDYCFNFLVGDGTCDIRCNKKDCEFDGGDCN